jgi:hypothetical protein
MSNHACMHFVHDLTAALSNLAMSRLHIEEDCVTEMQVTKNKLKKVTWNAYVRVKTFEEDIKSVTWDRHVQVLEIE